MSLLAKSLCCQMAVRIMFAVTLLLTLLGGLGYFLVRDKLAENASTATLLVALGVSIVLLDVLLAFMIRRLVRRSVIQPIKELEHYADAINAGIPIQNLPNSRDYQAEIESLRASIERTMGSLHARYEEVRKSEVQYKLLAEHIGDVVWTMDRSGLISYISPSIQRLTGFTQEEMTGRHFFDALAPASLAFAKEKFAGLLSDAMLRRFTTGYIDLELLTKQSGTRWSEVLVDSRYDADGAFIGFLGVARDISQRRAMEQALRQAEAKYRSIFENSVTAIFQTTPDGHFITANPACCHIMGYDSADEIIRPDFTSGNNFFKNKERRDQMLVALKANGEVRNYEVELKHKNGNTIWGSFNIRAHRDADGNLLFLEGDAADVTQRKTAEESEKRLQAQLVQAQKLEAIGTLASGIAHDFNNILAIIMGCAEMIREETSGQADVQEDIATIISASERGKNLVRQILAFCRKAKQERKNIELAPVVREALQFLRSTVPANITINSKIEDNLPRTLADPTQMHQILINLCTNAVHAISANNGLINVELSRFTADAHFIETHPSLRPIEYLHLSVSDNGHGMNAATLKRIFEPFFTTKAQGVGTGLGLSVVHGIVADHDGGIFVYSHLGEGTVFHIYLPATTSGNIVTPLNRASVRRGNGEKILYVDDEEALCLSAERTLKRIGYSVTTCQDAQAALALLKTSDLSFDLILTDLAMPGMTGLEFSSEVLRLRPGSRIILMSGYSGNLTLDSIKSLGLADLAIKPLSIAELGELIARNITAKAAASV